MLARAAAKDALEELEVKEVRRAIAETSLLRVDAPVFIPRAFPAPQSAIKGRLFVSYYSYFRRADGAAQGTCKDLVATYGNLTTVLSAVPCAQGATWTR